MGTHRSQTVRVLALDPISRGFGYAILEGAETLVDWGIAHVQADREAGSLERIDELLERYRPDVIILEDIAASGSRRSGRVRKLIVAILKLALARDVAPRFIARTAVSRALRQLGGVTKHEIATALAARFPELGPRLPPRRRTWMSEDPRTAIFDAVGLALTYFAKRKKQQRQRS